MNRKNNDIFTIKINGSLVLLRQSKVSDIKGFLPRYEEDIKALDDIKNYIRQSLSRTLIINGEVVALGGVLAIAPRIYNSWNIVSKKYIGNKVALFKGLHIAFTQMQHFLYVNKQIDYLFALVSADRQEAIRFNKLFGFVQDNSVNLPEKSRYILMKKTFKFI